jgi:hypothetical protein
VHPRGVDHHIGLRCEDGVAVGGRHNAGVAQSDERSGVNAVFLLACANTATST